MKIITLRIFLLVVVLSCGPKVDKEEVTGFHENGKLSYQYFLVDGKREGTYLEYYPTGNLQIEKEYQSDTIIAQKIWDINGKILVNYVIMEGRYYGLLGSSSCISVFPEE